jgi:hypothetical protein
MAEIAGKTAVVYILTGAVAMTSSTGATINGVDSSTYAKLCDILDISQFGDTHKDRLAGMKDTNLSLSGNYDSADSLGQAELEPGDFVYAGVYHNGTGNAGLGQAKFLVESYEHGASATGKQTFSAKLSGVLAPVALPAQS